MKYLLFLLALCGPILACTYPNYYMAEANWMMEEPFILECLSKNPIEDGKKIEAMKEQLLKLYPNLFLSTNTLNIQVDVEERKNADKAPIVTLRTGGHGLNGSIARFEKQLPTFGDLERIATSPVKLKLIKELSKKNLVLLILCSTTDLDINERFEKCANKGAKMAKDMAKKKCSILKANLDDPAESYLMSNIFIGNRVKRPGILILFGKGKGLYFIDNYDNSQVIMEIAHQLDNSTDAEAQKLEPRLFINAPYPF